MDDWKHREIIFELRVSNTLMKAMVSELSQIKFELVNERIKRDGGKIAESIAKQRENGFIPVAQTGPSEYMPTISSASGKIPSIDTPEMK